MPIIKTIKDRNFMILDNSTARDRRLALHTSGFLVHILSYSDEFDLDVPELMKLFKIGREKLLKITTELKNYGYLIIEPKITDGGILDGKQWTFYDVSQCPDKPVILKTRTTANNLPKNDIVPSYGKPVILKNRSTENQHDFKRKTVLKRNKKTKNIDNKETTESDSRRVAFEAIAFFSFGIPFDKVQFMSEKQKQKIELEISRLEALSADLALVPFFGEWWRQDWRSFDRRANRFQRPRVEQFGDLWFEFCTSDELSEARITFENECKEKQNNEYEQNSDPKRFATKYDYSKFATIKFD